MATKRILAKLAKAKTRTSEELEPSASRASSSKAALPEQADPDTRIEKYGLFRLNPEELDIGEIDYALDIVAVHGITGDAYRTWTAENGKLWLRDFLPAQFPGARIFSYGYPAEVFYSKSTAGLDDYARKLLEELKSERSGSKDQFRRIIFLCHSMGGLVVKKALVITCLDAVDYGHIRGSICSILFFGTPHRGSGLAATALALARIFKVANLSTCGLGGNTRTDLVQGLVIDSQLVKELSRDVRNQLTGINIACFVEKANSMPLNTVIVDDTTATMNIPGERVIPMHGKNHRQLCQFGNDRSSDYRVVSGLIREWTVDAKQTRNELNEEDIACLQSLSFPEMESRRGEAKHNMHPQTCQWILQHKSYQSWMNQDRGLLWVKGKPGSGKSTVMSFLYTKLLSEACQDVLVLEFFFHGRGSTLQKTSQGMLRTLLHQAVRGSPLVRRTIRPIFTAKEMFGQPGVDWYWELHELENILGQAILDISRFRNLLIFVDALDEAGVEAESVLHFLHKMNDKFEPAKSKAKICIACRHYPILTSSIQGLEVVVEDNNREDIACYIHSKLLIDSLTAEHISDKEAWREIEQKIASKASGLFQWVRLATGLVVEQRREGISWREIRGSLEKVPEGLFATYRHILGCVIKPGYRKRAQLLMEWVCFAKQPLTVTELRYAMACDTISPSQETCEDTEDFVETDERMKKLITSQSGGLVEVISSSEGRFVGVESVQFIHQSINDFMRSGGLRTLSEVPNDTEASLGLIGIDTTFIGQSHDRLSRSCINCLSLVQNSRHLFLTEELPFRDYAWHYWFKHAEEAEANGVLQTDLVKSFPTISTVCTNGSRLGRRLWPMSLLHFSALSNLYSVVQLLIQNGTDLDERDPIGHTALHYSAMFGHESLMCALIDANADISAETNAGETILISAAGRGRLNIVKQLLSRGAPINKNNGCKTGGVLYHACQNGNISLVRYLLKSGAEVNTQGGPYWTALQVAARQRHKTAKAIVQLLLDNGAQVNMEGGYFGSALLAASTRFDCTNYDSSIFKLLLDHGADIEAQGKQGNILQLAAAYGNTTIVKFYLETGRDINVQGGSYGSAIQAASILGSKKMLMLLLDEGANINIQGGKYGSALQAASYNGNKEMVHLLLNKGADINALGGKYGHALQAASYFGMKHLKFVPSDEKAYFNAQEREFESARKAAQYKRQLEIVEVLLYNGADVNAQGGRYGSALYAATMRGNREIVELLLKNGADVNGRGGKHGSALQVASLGGNPEMVKLLLNNKADVNAPGGKYGSALAVAKRAGSRLFGKEVVELLLDQGALWDPGWEDYNTWLQTGMDMTLDSSDYEG